MPSPKGSEWNFDTVASKYEKMRSGYVDELYQEKFDYDMKDVWMYNDNRMGTVLYALVCIVSVIGVGVVFFMFCLEKKERKRYRKEN